jgi:carboxyl-terminal processing protease
MTGTKASWLAVTLVALCGVFVLGFHIGKGTVPVVEQVTALINKEGDVLSAQVTTEQDAGYDFGTYWRVWNILERKYIPYGTTTAHEVTAEDRVLSSIEGLVASYDDPYTVFMRPQQATDFKIATQGSLEGIGAIIGEREGRIIVVGPLDESPAAVAGLVAGDVILKVDDFDTAEQTVGDVVERIRGPKGSTVSLLIQSEGEEPRDVPIVRGTIEIPSTSHSVIEREIAIAPKETTPTTPASTEPTSAGASPTDPGPAAAIIATTEPEPEEPTETELQSFYHLHLFSFSQSSIRAFERELKSFVENGTDSLIIDLRGNPGGYIESAIQIASWFLPRGAVVVREFAGPEQKETPHVARGNSLFTSESQPSIAVLVDKGSASASEILAGALQEHGVATVIGTNTFGKGSVQELIDVTDELTLKVTVARWYTPKGVSISQGGLTPDVRIDPATSTSSDEWLEAAIAVLSGEEYEAPADGGTLEE